MELTAAQKAAIVSHVAKSFNQKLLKVLGDGSYRVGDTIRLIRDVKLVPLDGEKDSIKIVDSDTGEVVWPKT